MTGVKGDLLSIANAERSFNATEGHYGSLEDLVSGHYVREAIVLHFLA